MTKIFHFIFLRRKCRWIFRICEFFASMEANLQNPWKDFFLFKMAAFNMAAWSRKFLAYFDIFVIFLFKKIFDDERLSNSVYRGFIGRWLRAIRYCYQFAEIQDRDPIWRPKISKIVQFLWNSGYRGFLGRWLRICYQFLQIQDGGSNMAVKNFENCLITIPLYTLFGKHSSSTIFLN